MLAAIACLALMGMDSQVIVPTHLVATASKERLSIGYAGVDYYQPSQYFTHCASYTWLRSSCYDTPANSDPPRAQLISDLQFTKRQDLGSVQRVWISLDQLMRWGPKGAFEGFVPGGLHNVDDMLSLDHRYQIKVILVLFVYDSAHDANEFQPTALDGNHSRLRHGYLRADRLFIGHLAGNSVDVSTAPIVELANEPYFQFEEYFNDPSNLGRFRACASNGRTDWGCVDTKIIHPWLSELYATARQASTRFKYTFSDTGRLFENYGYWSRMYPQDLIDEHLYDSAPWAKAWLYARGRRFPKPWIATEVGCDTGAVSCTYSGTASAPVDEWWLTHLRADGAQAVLVDSHVTLWQYPDGPDSQVPTKTGRDVMLATKTNAPSPATP